MNKVVIIAFLILLTSGFTISKRVDALIAKEIKKVFHIETFTKQSVTIPNEINEILPLKITGENFFKITNNNRHLGYYYFGQAYGKADYFDFIVIFDTELIVSKIKIVVYREDHGGEIGSKRWLKQFKGKSKDMDLKYQKNISAISGATISAKAMTREVNKLLQTIKILDNKQQL